MKLVLALSAVLLVTGCADNNPVIEQNVTYIDLKNAKAGYNQPYLLDIDLNGKVDYVFNATLLADDGGDHLRFAILSLYNNEVIGKAGNVDVLSAGDEIAQGSSFDYDIEVLAVRTTSSTGSSWSGNWKGVQNKFVGLRCRFDGFDHYGWLRITLDELHEQVVIHDMAYQREAYRGILAGALNN